MTTQAQYLDGKILIAMPTMDDPRFAKAIIYMCAHSDDGAMGIIINKPAPNMEFTDLLSRLNISGNESSSKNNIDIDPSNIDLKVLFGGPVEPSRGFVLHSGEYNNNGNTLAIDANVGLTATLDVLHEIAKGQGPRQSLLALGYAGWSPGQLEAELLANGWLHCSADDELLFGSDLEFKYDAALEKIGVSAALLSSQAGHA